MFSRINQIILVTTFYSFSVFAAEVYDSIVIGGGVSGMSASYELQKAGQKTLLLEASSQLGGRLTSDEIAGIPFDWAAQVISKNSEYMLPLVKELGLENELVEISSKMTYLRNGVYAQVEVKKPWTLFSSGLLSLRKSLSIFSIFYDLPKVLSHAPWKETNDYANWWKLDKNTASDFARKYFDSDSLTYFLGPTLYSFFYLSLKETSEAFLLWYLKILTGGTPFYTLKNGLGSITPVLAKRLNYRVNSKVTKVEEKDGLVEIQIESGQVYKAKYVVLAVPAPVVKKLYHVSNRIEENLLKTTYKKVIVITLKTNRDWQEVKEMKNSYAIFFPRPNEGFFGSVAFESSKPGRVQAGEEVLQVFLTDKKSEEFFTLGEDEIIERILPELEKNLPGVTNSVETFKLKKWNHAMVRVPVGKAKLLRRYKLQISNSRRRIILAGDHMNLPGTEGSRLSGLWAAELILEQTSGLR